MNNTAEIQVTDVEKGMLLDIDGDWREALDVVKEEKVVRVEYAGSRGGKRTLTLHTPSVIRTIDEVGPPPEE